MKLGAFFTTIAPYMEGRAGHDETMAALYGAELAAHEVDAERLAIYSRFCRTHRFEAVSLFGETRAAVIALHGEPAWERLVEDFFIARPMRHFELNENAAELSSWLSEVSIARGLPSWIAELADLEWWMWRVEMGAHGDEAIDEGPLRIGASVELRPYTHDLIEWLDSDQRPPAPAQGDRVVVFWRDRELDGCRADATQEELVVLKMVSESIPIEALTKATGLSAKRIKAVRADLHEAGILVGALDEAG